MKPSSGRGTAVRRAALVLVCAVSLGTFGAAGPVSAEEVAPDAPTIHAESLSAPNGTGYWAYVLQRVPVRATPRSDGPVLTTLGTRTGDGTDELLLLVQETLDLKGRTWVQVRLPVRPNNQLGWVPAAALSEYQAVNTRLMLNRGRMLLTLRRNNRVVFRARVGVGKRQWPTPRGEFYIRTRLTNPGTGYGPLAFGTSAMSVLTDWPGGGVVGIHGTDQPELLPGRVSHGCIRLRNQDILRLGRMLPVGTPFSIVN